MSEGMGELREIVVEEEFPNRPETIWQALITGPLIGRWLGMTPDGFAAMPGTRFTYRTTPAGEWDGTIHCEVMEAVANERLVYAWRSGHEGNTGYGAPLDTVVTFTLEPTGAGTRVRLVHAGFRLPRNATAYAAMGQGWKGCARKLHGVAHELE